MKHTLEDELRSAYAQLPQEHRDPTEVMSASRKSAHRLRRRRTAGVCAGAIAAALVVGATAVIGTNLGAGQQETGLRPADGPTATPSVRSTPSPPPARAQASPKAGTTAEHPRWKEGTDKPLAGLSGRLLPHGTQLPDGMAYHGTYTYDYQKTWSTSLEDGYAGAMPVLILTGADQNFDSPPIAQTEAAYGILSGVQDMATTAGRSERTLDASIVRFRSPEFAQSAIAKAKRHESGLYWVWKQQTTPNVPWDGVPGVTGDHGVFNLPAGPSQPLIVAYQVVGEFIVASDSQTASVAEQGVTDMVTNLKDAGLLK